MAISLEEDFPSHHTDVWGFLRPSVLIPCSAKNMTLTEASGIYPCLFKDNIQPPCTKSHENYKGMNFVFLCSFMRPCPYPSISSMWTPPLRKANLSRGINEWTRYIMCSCLGQEKDQCTYERDRMLFNRRKGFEEWSKWTQLYIFCSLADAWLFLSRFFRKRETTVGILNSNKFNTGNQKLIPPLGWLMS